MREFRSFGPMHGERTARHQFLAESNGREDPEGIFTAYEVKRGDSPRLCVEFMVDRHVSRLAFTVEEARYAAGVFADFVVAWQSDEAGS